MHSSQHYRRSSEDIQRERTLRTQKNRARKAAERKRHTEAAVSYRTKNLPSAITILAVGILLIISQITLSSLTTQIDSGFIPNKGGIIGPFEINNSHIQNLSLEYPVNQSRNKWCSVTVLLLDKNQNYITGCNKDLYYESTFGTVYSDTKMVYKLKVEQEGTYYYQLLTQHPNPTFKSTSINYTLSSQAFGTSFMLFFGIIITIVGGLYIGYAFMDWELTQYIPSLKTEYSIARIKKTALISAPVFIILLLIGMLKVGYADTQNAPASFFSNDDTHYFGK